MSSFWEGGAIELHTGGLSSLGDKHGDVTIKHGIDSGDDHGDIIGILMDIVELFGQPSSWFVVVLASFCRKPDFLFCSLLVVYLSREQKNVSLRVRRVLLRIDGC